MRSLCPNLSRKSLSVLVVVAPHQGFLVVALSQCQAVSSPPDGHSSMSQRQGKLVAAFRLVGYCSSVGGAPFKRGSANI